MPNNTELNRLNSIIRLRFAKNHQTNHYCLEIHRNCHCLCHSLYYDL